MKMGTPSFMDGNLYGMSIILTAMNKVTDIQLISIGFKLEGNRWVHKKGTYIYTNKMSEYTLEQVVDILTGTAYKLGQNQTIQ